MCVQWKITMISGEHAASMSNISFRGLALTFVEVVTFRSTLRPDRRIGISPARKLRLQREPKHGRTSSLDAANLRKPVQPFPERTDQNKSKVKSKDISVTGHGGP
jgi:hypothetical protein